MGTLLYFAAMCSIGFTLGHAASRRDRRTFAGFCALLVLVMSTRALSQHNLGDPRYPIMIAASLLFELIFWRVTDPTRYTPEQGFQRAALALGGLATVTLIVLITV